MNTIAPPDVQIAVGPEHVLELVNWIGAIWKKDGTRLSTFHLYELFNVAPGGIADPRALYDDESGRWFASAADFDTGEVLLAVSATSDPTGTWYHSSVVAAGSCADQPHLGLSDDVVAVSANVFNGCNGGFLGGQFWVINKTDLLSGAAPRYTVYGPSGTYSLLHPVHSLSSTTTQYLVRSVPDKTIQVLVVTGVPPGSVSLTSWTIHIATFGANVDAAQQGSTYLLDTGDRRIHDALWDRGTIWLGMNVGCVPSGDSATRTCLRLVAIDPANRTVLQDFDVGESGRYYFYPALRTDSFGNLIVALTISSSGMYASAAIAARAASDPPNSIGAPRIVRGGTGSEKPPYGYCSDGVSCRWGDYLGAARDPSDSAVVWTAGQYATATGWGTYVVQSRMQNGNDTALTASYSVVGGGSGFTPPTLTYVLGGVTRTIGLTMTPTTISVDAESPWNITNPLGGSSSSERWTTDGPTEGIAGPSTTIAPTYYHQAPATFSFSVVGGSGFGSPSVAYSSFGRNWTTSAGANVWADNGTPYAFDVVLPGSSPWSAWRTGQATGTIGNAPYAAVYYEQYLVGFRYRVVGGDPPAAVPPSVNCTVHGIAGSVAADGAHWVDAGSGYAYPSMYIAPTGGERWIGLADARGTITGPANLSADYYHQVMLTVLASPTKGGLVAPASEWYNASTTITVTASPNRHWRFMGWAGSGNGSYSGTDRSAIIVLREPISEVAEFRAGAKFRASAGGGISWQYGKFAGAVAAGAEETLYIPSDVALTLIAHPDPFWYFQGWAGDISDSGPIVTFLGSEPLNVTANFAINSPMILVSVGGTAIIVGAIARGLARRSRRKKQRAAERDGSLRSRTRPAIATRSGPVDLEVHHGRRI